MDQREHQTALIVFAVIIVALQWVIVPHIAVFSAQPNLILVYLLAVVVCFPEAPVLPYALVMGLIYDFMGTSPVGAMAFVCVLLAFLASRLAKTLGVYKGLVPLVTVLVFALLGELIYAILMLLFGIDASVLSALGLRVLPCALYDFVAAIILVPLVARVFLGPSSKRSAGKLKFR